MNNSSNKQCIVCSIFYDDTKEFFCAHNRRSDKVNVICKKCCKTCISRNIKIVVPNGYTRCRICEQILLDIDENFIQNRHKSRRKSFVCRKCSIPLHKTAREEKKNGLRIPKVPKPDFIVCQECGQEKRFTIENFPKTVRDSYGLNRQKCRICYSKELHDKRSKNRKEVANKVFSIPHRAMIIAVWENRRAKEKNFLIEKIYQQDIIDMFLFQEGCCFYCLKSIKEYFELDHMTPVTKGGKHEKDNCVLACRSCNSQKYNKPYNEWIEYVEKIILKDEQNKDS